MGQCQYLQHNAVNAQEGKRYASLGMMQGESVHGNNLRLLWMKHCLAAPLLAAVLQQ